MAVMPGFITVSPLHGEPLHFRSMTGSEEMGRPFEYVVDVLSKKPDLKLGDALGQQMTVTVQSSTRIGARFFNGIVSRFSQIGMYGNYYAYRAVLHPWLWLLNRFSDCRIFQNKSVPTVLDDICGKYQKILAQYGITVGFRSQLENASKYPAREYTVQYRETDLNFVSRLLEEAGISYHFEHDATSHTMVLTDSSQGRATEDGYAAIPLRPAVATGESECLTAWHVTQEMKTASYMLRDFDYMNPGAPVQAKLTVTKAPDDQKGQAPARQVVGEFYDYPGRFLAQNPGDQAVSVRLNEAQSFYEVVHASGNTRGIGVGNLFSLADSPFDSNASYLVVRARYDLRGHDPESGAASPGHDSFQCSMTLLSSAEPFRPARLTPRPVVQGPQTAIVVSPKKNPDEKDKTELWTDELGRVLVRFHWERLGHDKPDDPSRGHDEDENSDSEHACWVRVASLWAGQQWGVQFTPRIGHEVMVEFLEGDPDRPIVTGRVYNNLNKPPYGSAKGTQSGIKTHSTVGGGADNFNEIRFEDKKGSEELFVQAEKNHTVKVKADRSVSVGGNETYTVTGKRTTEVKKDDKLTIDGKHDMTVTHLVTQTFNEGHTLNVNKADQTITIETNKTETIKENYTLNPKIQFKLQQGDGKNTLTAVGDTMVMNGPMSVNVTSDINIKLAVGDTSITLTKDKIEIHAKTVVITGDTETDVSGAGASAKFHGTVDVSGTAINLNS